MSWAAAIRSSGRWRLMVATAGIAAIIVAAIVGWNIYQHSPAAASLSSPVPLGSTGQGGSGSVKAGASGGAGGSANPGTTGNHKGSTTSGHRGKPSPSPSRGGKSSASTTPSSSPSTSPSSSPTPTPSATPTPSTSPAVLPAGYRWHRFTAAEMGTVAGFKIGAPDPWTQSIVGVVAHVNQKARNFHIVVNLNNWAFAKPLRQAEYLADNDADTYNNFQELVINSIGFEAAGGYRPAPAAELEFSWTGAETGINYTELVLLVTLSTQNGSQPYALAIWAPSSTFGSADYIFQQALGTFRTLPGA
jgi:hypothetical protein